MADITMCEGLACQRKEQCYRFTAEKNPYRQPSDPHIHPLIHLFLWLFPVFYF